MGASPQAAVTRILIVHSTRDEQTDDRIWKMQQRAEKLGLELRHLSIITEEYAALGANGPRPGDWITQNEGKLLIRVKRQIREWSPEYLLLHTGVAFMFAAPTILRVISELKSQFPTLVLGIQPSRILEMTIEEGPPVVASRVRDLFDHGPRTQELLHVMFP